MTGQTKPDALEMLRDIEAVASATDAGGIAQIATKAIEVLEGKAVLSVDALSLIVDTAVIQALAERDARDAKIRQLAENADNGEAYSLGFRIVAILDGKEQP